MPIYINGEVAHIPLAQLIAEGKEMCPFGNRQLTA
jgi:hypothetical protein